MRTKEQANLYILGHFTQGASDQVPSQSTKTRSLWEGCEKIALSEAIEVAGKLMEDKVRVYAE